MHRYPRCWATMASPMPVFPLVGSTMVPPGRSSPEASAASIIRSAMRSFTEPPGLTYSTLASTSGASGPRCSVTRRSRTRGVSPIRSTTDSAYCTGSPGGRRGRRWVAAGCGPHPTRRGRRRQATGRRAHGPDQLIVYGVYASAAGFALGRGGRPEQWRTADGKDQRDMSEGLGRLHAELAAVVLVDRELPDVLTEIVGISRRALPGAEAVSITLIRDDKAFPAAYDGQMAMDADEMQYARGYGPCLDAGRAGELFLIADMGAEDRWPDYTRQASERGVGSSLSVPLPFQGATIGALNIYSTRAGAFRDADVTLGEEAAAFVAIAVANAEAAARATSDADNLRRAMVSRATIEQAKGILMERYKVTAEQAFTLLTHASQRSNVKLRDVAEQLTTTGVLRGG